MITILSLILRFSYESNLKITLSLKKINLLLDLLSNVLNLIKKVIQ